MIRNAFDITAIACIIIMGVLLIKVQQQEVDMEGQSAAMLMMAQRNQLLSYTLDEVVTALEFLYNDTEGGTCGRQSV